MTKIETKVNGGGGFQGGTPPPFAISGTIFLPRLGQ